MPREPVVLDLFGGRALQTPGAINVDIVAQEGVCASAMQLPFKSGVADQVIASNPYTPAGSGEQLNQHFEEYVGRLWC